MSFTGSADRRPIDRRRSLIHESDQRDLEAFPASWEDLRANWHLKWCRFRREQMAARTIRRRIQKLRNESAKILFELGKLGKELVAQSQAAWLKIQTFENRVMASSPWDSLRRALGVPPNMYATSVIQRRLFQVIRRRFQPVSRLYRGIKLVWDLKCPFCGSHTVFRLCLHQTFRLFSLDIDHALEVLSSGVGWEEKIAVAVRLYGWSKFGSGGIVDLSGDLAQLWRLSGLGAHFYVPRVMLRLAADLVDSLYVLTGTQIAIPDFDSLVEGARRRQARLMGLDASELVWNVWFAFSRLTTASIRGTLLRLLLGSRVDDLAERIVRVQRLWYQGIDPLVASFFDEGVDVAYGGWAIPVSSPPTFQKFRSRLEQLAAERAATRKPASSGPPPPPPPPGPPPPPPPPPTRRNLPEPWSNMSIVEREVAYSGEEPWPRCHPGWLCSNRDTHCVYVIPGQVPVYSAALSPERIDRIYTLLATAGWATRPGDRSE